MKHNRLVIISNRLPFHIDKSEDGTISVTRSVGGLTTALGPLHDKSGSLWVGWSDVEDADDILVKRGCIPIHLTSHQVHGYYDGFSNSTLWPLFHGFTQNARFNKKMWDIYVEVNEIFRDAIVEIARPGDIFWVQDYHLLLLPRLLRQAIPDASIGFFLHIPFPDYEAFRMLPWRNEILLGMLGADLIGFHTYDYVRHFLSSCRRVLGMDDHMGSFMIEGRSMKTDVFPLGIDYEKLSSTAKSPEVDDFVASLPVSRRSPDYKTLLSVERLDYTKGIPARLLALDTFLERYPEWIGHLELVLITVPSRESVSSYHALKKQVDELVGRINGKYSRFDWAPISYHYRSFDFEELCGIYRESDVMVATPLRDGMNLVCKEYLAVHDGRAGVLVLSEMAGAADELGEAIVINPFDQDALVEAIHQALMMPEEVQVRRNVSMQARLKRYTAEKWAEDFLDSLSEVKATQAHMDSHLLSEPATQELLHEYAQAHRRVLLLDYDGTLVGFSSDPSAVAPDDHLLEMLEKLGNREGNTVVIMSGRDQDTLGEWFGALPISLVAEHGVWYSERPENGGKRKWLLQEPLNDAWKQRIRPILEHYVDRTPGSHVEEKDYSLVWHYRACEKDLAARRAMEVKRNLADSIGELGLSLMDGNKVIEIKPANIDKGSAAHRWFRDPGYEFILAAGDDTTDEDMFRAAPEKAWTLRVGTPPTLAHFTVKDVAAMRRLLERLVDL